MSDSLLTVTIRHAMQSVQLDVNFRLTQPWTVLFGPSGSGKTTILRTIAGLLRPDAGRISSGDRVYFDSSEDVFVPAYRRQIRSAAQSAKMFPHITVKQNVVYGSGRSSAPDGARQVAEEIMTSFRIEHLADRRPAELSGGESQRASVARALVSAITFDETQKPLLLLDEPLSGLDIGVRDEMIAALKQWTTQWKIPVLSVTHTLGEAFQLNAEIIKIGDGTVIEQGPVATVLEMERQQLIRQLGKA